MTGLGHQNILRDIFIVQVSHSAKTYSIKTTGNKNYSEAF